MHAVEAAQQRRLAAARRPDDRRHLSGVDAERDVAHDARRAEVRVERFGRDRDANSRRRVGGPLVTGDAISRSSRSATLIGIAISRSIAAEPETRAGREAGGDADDEDEAEEDERACPGLRVPVVVGADAHR